LRGISIKIRDELANAHDSMPINREFDSNELDESDFDDEKHGEPCISTFRGISIDSSDDKSKSKGMRTSTSSLP
jgi:hypothetical protein